MLLKREIFMYYINTSLLAYLLTGKYPADSNLVKNISNGIEGLAKKSIIILSQSNVNNEWIIDAVDIIKDKVDKPNDDAAESKIEYYVALNYTDIHKILTSSEKYYTRSISLLRFYVYVLSTIHKKKDSKYTGVGFTSIQKMVDVTGYNKKTIASYLKLLEDLELIYIHKSKDFILFEDGDIIEISHTYGKYENKENIISVGMKYAEEYGYKLKSKHKKIKKTKSDKTRGLSQKYNHIKRCIKEEKDMPYSYRDWKEIYFAMRDLNIKNKIAYPDRVKDLSMFSNYDFYECD